MLLSRSSHHGTVTFGPAAGPVVAGRTLSGMDFDSDAELWRRSCAGDGAAYGELFDRHQLAVYRTALAATGDPHLAEDVVSMTFLDMWRHRRKVELHADSLRPWLIGVCRNILRNQARAARRYRRLLDKLPSSVVPDSAERVVSRVDAQRRLDKVQATLKWMSPDERDVVRLCVWAGLTQVEAAEILGIPVATVKSRLQRVREKLRAAEQADPHPGRHPSHLNHPIGDTP